MDRKLSPHIFIRPLAFTIAAFGLVLAAYSTASTTTDVSAAGRLNTWLSTGCSVRNGVSTAKVTINASTTGELRLQHATLNIDNDGTNEIDDSLANPTSYSKTFQSSTLTFASHPFTYTMQANDTVTAADTVKTITGNIQISPNGCRVSQNVP